MKKDPKSRKENQGGVSQVRDQLGRHSRPFVPNCNQPRQKRREKEGRSVTDISTVLQCREMESEEDKIDRKLGIGSVHDNILDTSWRDNVNTGEPCADPTQELLEMWA